MPPSAWTSLPVLARERAREGAFLVAEQLAVDDVGGDRLAVEREQRALGAQAGGVDRAGDGFLAGAGLADDQDRQAVARGLGGDRQRGAEFGRGADQLLERQRAARASRKPARARRRRGGGRHWRRALRAAARARPGGPGNRRRRRASPRPRRRPMSPCDRTMTGRLGALLAQRGDQLRALARRPSCRAARPGLRGRAAPGAAPSAVSSSAAPTDAPAGARGDRRDQPALVGVGVEQQQRTCRFFAHHRPFARHPRRTGVKAALKRSMASSGLGQRCRLVMDAPTHRRRRGECTWPKKSRC